MAGSLQDIVRELFEADFIDETLAEMIGTTQQQALDDPINFLNDAVAQGIVSPEVLDEIAGQIETDSTNLRMTVDLDLDISPRDQVRFEAKHGANINKDTFKVFAEDVLRDVLSGRIEPFRPVWSM